MDITRRSILKAFGIGTVAAVTGVSSAAEPINTKGPEVSNPNTQEALEFFQAIAKNHKELKATSTDGYRQGDMIQINGKTEFKPDGPIAWNIVPTKIDLMVQGIKDHETLIVSRATH